MSRRTRDCLTQSDSFNSLSKEAGLGWEMRIAFVLHPRLSAFESGATGDPWLLREFTGEIAKRQAEPADTATKPAAAAAAPQPPGGKIFCSSTA